MSKSILDFTNIKKRSGAEFTQVKGRSGIILWCKPYTLTLSSKPTGVDTITCYRYSSNQPGASTGTSAVLTNGSTIYHGDVIYISASASSGYYDPTISSSTGTISNNKLTVDGNESITVTAGGLATAAVYITKGTGVSSAYLSSSSTATSGSASGTEFNIGSTVYAFVTLSTGYNPDSGWTLISGSTYRVGSKTVNADSSNNDFGTINATLASYTISFGGTGATWSSSTKTAYYGDTLSTSGTTVTCTTSSNTTRWTNTASANSNYRISGISGGSGTVTGGMTVTANTVETRTLSVYNNSSYTVTISGSYITSSSIAPYTTWTYTVDYNTYLGSIYAYGSGITTSDSVTIGYLTSNVSKTITVSTTTVTKSKWDTTDITISKYGSVSGTRYASDFGVTTAMKNGYSYWSYYLDRDRATVTLTNANKNSVTYSARSPGGQDLMTLIYYYTESSLKAFIS